MRRLFHPEPPKRPPLDRRPNGHHQLQRLPGHLLVNEPHTRIVPNKAAADSRTQLHALSDVEDLHSAVIRPGGQDVFVNVQPGRVVIGQVVAVGGERVVALGGAVRLGVRVAEVVGAKLSRSVQIFAVCIWMEGGTFLSYRVSHPCDCDHVLVDTAHVVDFGGVLDPRSHVLGAAPGVPQLHGSPSASFDEDGWAEPVYGYGFSIQRFLQTGPVALSLCD